MRASRAQALLIALCGVVVSMLVVLPAAQAAPEAISGVLQFPEGTFPPDIDPDLPDIAVFDRGDDEIHYEVFGDHEDLSGLNAALSWDVDTSQLRWALVAPPEATYRFTVFWSRWVYTGPIPEQVESEQLWLSSSTSSLVPVKGQATVYPLGTSDLFHCAYGFDGCTSGGGGTSPAVTAGTPTITGTARVGERLTAAPGAWQPGDAGLAYQWLRDGKNITGATSTSYVAGALDAGRRLSVRVTGSRPGYTTTSATSAQTQAVARGRLSGPTPTIAGKARVGRTLTAKVGTWKPAGVTFSFQWFADGQRIAKANRSTYQVAGSVKGTRLTVKVTGTKSGYTTLTRASAATRKVRG